MLSPKNEAITSDSLQNIYLKEFQKNNPHCNFTIEDEQLILLNPWGEEDCRLAFPIDAVDLIKDLNNVIFDPQFDAVIHLDTNEIEFIYAFVTPDDERSKNHIDRNFTMFFENIEINCRFAEPTNRLMTIARHIKRTPSESGIKTVFQLRAFTDYQRLDELPEVATVYFEKREPRSFFVNFNKPVQNIELRNVTKHINFIMNYYDRSTPVININEIKTDKLDRKTQPIKRCGSNFPDKLSLSKIDEFILQLIEVARATSPRFAFIYYFQVIEYAGYYYVDEKAKKALKSILRDPALITCEDDLVRNLFEILTDIAHNEESRMRKVVEDYCDPKSLWVEIENDKEFFSSELIFDGGFRLPALISADTTCSSWESMCMPKLFDQITKIRNCLVHARERRQNNVIQPTSTNNIKISRYLPVLARIAEEIAIKND